MDIPSPGMKMGQLANKLGWKEKWMDSGSLATIIYTLRMLIN
jgi:hypothetical protein